MIPKPVDIESNEISPGDIVKRITVYSRTGSTSDIFEDKDYIVEKLDSSSNRIWLQGFNAQTYISTNFRIVSRGSDVKPGITYGVLIGNNFSSYATYEAALAAAKDLLNKTASVSSCKIFQSYCKVEIDFKVTLNKDPVADSLNLLVIE